MPGAQLENECAKCESGRVIIGPHLKVLGELMFLLHTLKSDKPKFYPDFSLSRNIYLFYLKYISPNDIYMFSILPVPRRLGDEASRLRH